MPFKPVGIDDAGKLPTRARAGIADDIADPASVIGSALTASYVTSKDRGAAALGNKAYATTDPATPNQQLRVLALGDSIANYKWRYLYAALNRAWGGGAPGAVISRGASDTVFSPPSWSLPGTGVLSTTGTVTNRTTDFDRWFSGLSEELATGATIAYGVGGVNATWDSAKVYYSKGTTPPDGGTFKIQVDGVDEGATVDTNAAAGMGIVTITKDSVAQRGLSVINLTGNVRILGVAFFNSTQPGVLFSSISQGGIRLDDAVSTAAGRDNLAAFLADYQPDLITLEMKENSSYYATALDTLLDIIDASAPAATFVGIGSTPVASGDADQVIQNQQLRQACADHGKVYWDGYVPFGSYATLNALGMAGDGIHVSDKANALLAGLMARDLGLFDHPLLGGSARNQAAVNARITNRLDLGAVRTDGNALANASLTISSLFDLFLTLRRILYIVGSSGTADANSWVMRPDNTGDQQIPDGSRIGTSGVYLRAANAATALRVMSARGGGALRDVEARSFSAGVQNVTHSAAGTLTIDLSLGSVIVVTLQANVTQITFTNAGAGGQEVEVHFKQDATGGRTVAAAAGGPVRFNSADIDGTADARTVVGFRQIGLGYFQQYAKANVS